MSDPEEEEKKEDPEFHDYTATTLDRTKLKKLSVGPGVMLYSALIFFTLAVIGGE